MPNKYRGMSQDEIWALVNSDNPTELLAMLKAANTTNTFLTKEMLESLGKHPDEVIAKKAREIEKLQAWMKKVAPIVIASVPLALLFTVFVLRH